METASVISINTVGGFGTIEVRGVTRVFHLASREGVVSPDGENVFFNGHTITGNVPDLGETIGYELKSSDQITVSRWCGAVDIAKSLGYKFPQTKPVYIVGDRFIRFLAGL